MGFTLEDFERYIAEIRRRRKRRLPKKQGYRLFQTVISPGAEGSQYVLMIRCTRETHRYSAYV